jgi:polyisoprenoid-binding protein YceI
MNRLKLISFVAGALLANTAAFAATYSIDGSHSTAGFRVKHLVSKVTGSFKDFSGTFTFDEKNPKAIQGKFSAKAESIFTNDAKRDEHLRSPDFFEVAKYPTVDFVAKEMKAAGKNKYKLSGDFTLHGVTKPVTFDVEYLGAGADPWGNQKVGFTALAKINRKDFGMVWNKTLDKGGLLVGEEVELEIQVEANAQK